MPAVLRVSEFGGGVLCAKLQEFSVTTRSDLLHWMACVKYTFIGSGRKQPYANSTCLTNLVCYFMNILFVLTCFGDFVKHPPVCVLNHFSGVLKACIGNPVSF
jgi:hypothetical protein